MARRLGLGATAVLRALAGGHRYGFDIMEATGLSSGSIYPALDKLEAEGLATATWEDEAIARAEKRPSRKYFEITPAGRERLAVALDQYAFLTGTNDGGKS
ncbi:MAG: PadR family transcriptional regulator [Acidobacteria bacterium]|nr:PadR family transcriptional regulator [Acidobacteriota bacterium]